MTMDGNCKCYRQPLEIKSSKKQIIPCTDRSHHDITFNFTCDTEIRNWPPIHYSASFRPRSFGRERHRLHASAAVATAASDALHLDMQRAVEDAVARTRYPPDIRGQVVEFALEELREILSTNTSAYAIVDLEFEASVVHHHLRGASSSKKYEVGSGSAAAETRCSICLEEFLDPGALLPCDMEDIGCTPCGHVFHDKCIQRWFRTRRYNSCPICRYEIVANHKRI